MKDKVRLFGDFRRGRGWSRTGHHHFGLSPVLFIAQIFTLTVVPRTDKLCTLALCFARKFEQ